MNMNMNMLVSSGEPYIYISSEAASCPNGDERVRQLMMYQSFDCIVLYCIVFHVLYFECIYKCIFQNVKTKLTK